MNQREIKSELEKMWEPRKAVPFNQRTPRDGEISNLLCSIMDDYLLTEEELKPIRERVMALMEDPDEYKYQKQFYK